MAFLVASKASELTTNNAIATWVGDQIRAFLSSKSLSWNQIDYDFYFDIIVSTTVKRYRLNATSETKYSFSSWRTSSSFPCYEEQFNCRIDRTSSSYCFLFTYNTTGVTGSSEDNAGLNAAVKLHAKKID